MDGLIKSSAISLTPKKQTRSSNLTLSLWFNLHPYIIWEIVYGIKWNTTWVRIKNCNKYGSVHCSYLKHPLLQLHIVASQVLLLQYVFMCVFVCVKAKKIYFYSKKLQNQVFQPSMQGVVPEKCSGSILQTCPLTKPTPLWFCTCATTRSTAHVQWCTVIPLPPI